MISGDVARRVASSQVVLDWLPVLVVAPILIIDAAISAAGKPLTAVNVLSAFVACLPLASWIAGVLVLRATPNTATSWECPSAARRARGEAPR